MSIWQWKVYASLFKDKLYDDASASALYLIFSQIAGLFSIRIFLIKKQPNLYLFYLLERRYELEKGPRAQTE